MFEKKLAKFIVLTGKCIKLKSFSILFFKFDERFRFQKWDKLSIIKEIMYLSLLQCFVPILT